MEEVIGTCTNPIPNPSPIPNPGAPMIAAALKETCDKLSDREKTVFRLHKENF